MKYSKIYCYMLVIYFLGGVCYGAMESEIKLMISESKKPRSAYLEYNKKYFNKMDSKEGEKNEGEEIGIINSRREYYIKEKIDCEGNRIYRNETDLRNLDKVLEKKKTAEGITSSRVSLSAQKLYDKKNRLMFKDNDTTHSALVSSIKQEEASGLTTLFAKSCFGIIDLGWLDQNISFEDKRINDQNLLTINTESNNGVTRTITCDPALGYRFYRYEIKKNGQLVKEVMADHYKMVDGYAYPFIYTERYYSGGDIVKSVEYEFKEVRFDVAFSDDDFKIFLPEGTRVFDGSISDKMYQLEKSGMRSIQDLLNTFAEQVVYEGTDDVGKYQMPEQKLIKSFILPNLKLAIESGRREDCLLKFLDDKLVAIPSEFKYTNNYINFKSINADLAWDGKLLIIKNYDIIVPEAKDDKLLKVTDGQWGGKICELTDFNRLPVKFVLKDKTATNYLITINHVATGEAYLMYEKQEK